MKEEKVLIIDDDPSILKALNTFFTNRNFKTLLAETGQEGLDLFLSEKPRLVLTDIQLPGINGLEVIKKIKEIQTDTSTIIVTGHPEKEIAINGLKSGACDFITKPINLDELTQSVNKAFERDSKFSQLQNYAFTLEKIAHDQEEKLKTMQNELVQSEKLHALGELTAGLTHEINQPLTALKLTCQEVLYSLDSPPEEKEVVKEMVGDMLSQVDAVSDIIRHMRSFTRNVENDAQEKVFIPTLVHNVLLLINYQFKNHGIEILNQVQPDLPKIIINPVKLEQVLMNLISNARDALNQSGKAEKRLLIKSELLKEKNEMALSFTDNGTGMPDKVRENIFKPFFTTKDRAQGTGLGLSISKRIIDSIGGKIEVQSCPQEGTTFKITLPIQEV